MSQNHKQDDDPILENLLMNAKKMNDRRARNSRFPFNIMKSIGNEMNSTHEAWHQMVERRKTQAKSTEAPRVPENDRKGRLFSRILQTHKPSAERNR